MKTLIVLACAIAGATALLSVLPAHAASKKHARSAAAALTAKNVNDATLVSKVGSRSHGAAVLRAQVLLDRAHFSPGEIDAGFGSNLHFAILGYQSANSLDATGIIDVGTWSALNRDTAPVLIDYTLTAADVAGPFNPIPAGAEAQAKLSALGYTSSIEELGERFHASPKLLQRLNPGKDFATAGDIIVVPDVTATVALPKGAKVVVDKSDSTVSLLDAAGKTLAQYPASTGSVHDSLPIGTWKIQGVAKNPTFHYNPALFWDADPTNAKATLPAGPNNPVGVVWIDLSKPHYGIHGTPEPSKIGKTESHGCIRLTNWDASELSLAVSPGMPAILQE